jgi:polysaccharide pyruvyl transferase WcaK-like protein
MHIKIIVNEIFIIIYIEPCVNKVRCKIKILVTSFFGNFGDEVLFDVLYNQLIKYLPQNSIKVLSNKKTYLEKNIESKPNTLLNFFKNTLESDAVIFTGGGIIQDRTSLLNVVFHVSRIFITKILKKKILLYAIGVEKLKFPVSVFMIKSALKRCDLIILRDKQSLDLLLDLGLNKDRLIVGCDLALNNICFKKQTKDSKENQIVISLMHNLNYPKYIPVSLYINYINFVGLPKNLNNFIDEFCVFITKMIEINYKIIFIPFSYNKDLKLANYIEKKIKNKNFIIYKELLTLDKIREIYSKSLMLIGMRLHSIILSYCFNTPFIALPYSSKIENFLENNDLIDYKVDFSNFKSDELIKKITFIQNEYDAVQEKLLINKKHYSHELMNMENQLKKFLDL